MSITPPPAPDRTQAAAAVLAAKRRLGLRWADLGQAVGRSTEWTTSALLGQQTISRDDAEKVGAALGDSRIVLDDAEVIGDHASERVAEVSAVGASASAVVWVVESAYDL